MVCREVLSTTPHRTLVAIMLAPETNLCVGKVRQLCRQVLDYPGRGLRYAITADEYTANRL
ncbi:MAG: hypothetical protein J07HX5_01532 [halophilic archaeon J07HX5]|nr:MAG: hypothetical protein J07HX5_01532 [halophilic archaeon J07HX5]